MRLNNLKLNNFRNFAQNEIALTGGTSVFYGGVGEGKTNLIEAIFLLSVGRSYRTSEMHHVISWGKEEAYVRGEGGGQAGDITVAIKVTKTGKKYEINGENNKKSIDLIGSLHSVMFHSEDLAIVGGAPQVRRKYLDIAISQSSKNYAHNLRDYYKILKQRNSALFDRSTEEAKVWDDQLANIGAWLTRVRAKVIEEISPPADRIFKSLAGNEEKLEIIYLPSGDADPDKLKDKLIKATYMDMARGITSVGPHRDDFKLLLSGVDARHFASSGEKKTIVLALKLAEVEFISSVTGETPILLLDDVFAMLDLKRSRALLDVTGDKTQCLITVTDLSPLKKEFSPNARFYEVVGGTIK